MNSPTVLLVDDEESVRNSILQSLQLADLHVETFSSAKELLHRLTPDFNGVILSDIRMPEMNGLELLKKCLAIDSKLPIILISGHADVSTAVNTRRDNHFVAINCGAIQEQLLNSELFGHEAGAFTDAKKMRIGKFEHANGGTLFLDEIESMAMTTQIPLLRVLQERAIERLGSNKSLPLDIRVLAATKVDLKTAAERNEFREDLYYRLNVVMLELPALRDRRADIPMLFQHFVLVAAARAKAEMPALDPKAVQVLLKHDWPGNIRELRNIAERYVLLGESFKFDLNALMHSNQHEEGLTLPEQMNNFERVLIEQTLISQKGDLVETMKALGLPRKTLADKLQKHQLNRKNYTK